MASQEQSTPHQARSPAEASTAAHKEAPSETPKAALPQTPPFHLDSDGIQREKMMSLGELTAGVAHELNNPIGYITSNINSLQKYITAMSQIIEQADALIDPTQREVWQQLQQQQHWDYIKDDVVNLINETTDGSEHLKAVVADLKMLGRSSLSSEYVSIDSCVRSALNVMAHQLKANTQVECTYAQCPPILLIRPQIIQAVTNLIHNAIQAMQPTGGKLAIRTCICTHENSSQRTIGNGTAHGNGVAIQLEDSGPGVARALQQHIFDPYYTTKSAQQGSGLGLAIVSEIMHQHGGAISYSTGSQYAGACFTLFFPLAS